MSSIRPSPAYAFTSRDRGGPPVEVTVYACDFCGREPERDHRGACAGCGAPSLVRVTYPAPLPLAPPALPAFAIPEVRPGRPSPR